MSRKSLTVEEVLQRTLSNNVEDVAPLLSYLGMSKNELELKKGSTVLDAKKIVEYLCKMGSNDLATLFRGGKGVSYGEVVFDVAKKLKVPSANENNSPETNENLIIAKLFEDTLDKMSDDEKRELFNVLGLTGADIPFSSAGTLITQVLLKKFGGFAIYRTSVIVANLVSRSILGSSLSFAANATLTRAIGTFLGPIGWIASGLWLAVDLSGPAYRKTIPAIVHIAMLRQIVTNRLNIGIVGDGSVGKDSLFKTVFNIDTNNVNPIAGSTKDAEIYELGDTGAINLINYPGFNDFRTDVNKLTDDFLHQTDVFLMVVDLTRGVSGTDVQILNKLKELNKPILVCLNKVDLIRPNNKEALIQAAKQRLLNVEMIETTFDPDERLHQGEAIGANDVFLWVVNKLMAAGKETGHLVSSRQCGQ